MSASRLYCHPEEFTVRLRQRMPMNVGFTFTAEQLDALRAAFGDRFDTGHVVDMRGRLHLPWSRYYLVFQIGRDRRNDLRYNATIRAGRTLVDSAICLGSMAGIAIGLALVALKLLF